MSDKKILNSVQKEQLTAALQEQYASLTIPEGTLYGKEEKRGFKIFLYTGSIQPTFNNSWLGYHLGTLKEEGFQPSIEGAQVIAASAKKNVVTITKNQAKTYLEGEEIEVEDEERLPYPLLKTKAGDVIGVFNHTPNPPINLTPPSRRTLRKKKKILKKKNFKDSPN